MSIQGELIQWLRDEAVLNGLASEITYQSAPQTKVLRYVVLRGPFNYDSGNVSLGAVKLKTGLFIFEANAPSVTETDAICDALEAFFTGKRNISLPSSSPAFRLQSCITKDKYPLGKPPPEQAGKEAPLAQSLYSVLVSYAAYS